jgi:hypothetical protein
VSVVSGVHVLGASAHPAAGPGRRLRRVAAVDDGLTGLGQGLSAHVAAAAGRFLVLFVRGQNARGHAAESQIVGTGVASVLGVSLVELIDHPVCRAPGAIAHVIQDNVSITSAVGADEEGQVPQGQDCGHRGQHHQHRTGDALNPFLGGGPGRGHQLQGQGG